MKANKFFKQAACAAFLAVFVLGLAAPAAVFADDGTPAEQPAAPAAEEAPQSVTPPAETEPTGEEPAAEETPGIVDPAAEGEPLVEEPAAEEALPEETGEVMQAIPEGTDLIVLDENGEALALGSQEAEQVMLKGDPMWCPNDVLPGGEGCTAGATTFLGGGGLLSQLAGKAGNGTIYVSYDYSAVTGVNDFNQYIVLDQTQPGLSSLDNLTIQGGWNFTTNQMNVGQDYSVFNFGTGSFSILNWANDVAIKNIQLEDTTGGLYQGALAVYNPSTGGDVLLQDVSVINSGGHAVVGEANERSGAFVFTAGNITVNDSRFSGNKSDGLIAASKGNVVLNGVEALSNEGIGVWVDNCLYDYGDGSCLTQGSVTLSGTNTFGLKQPWINLGNAETGLYIQTGGKVSADVSSILKAQGNEWIGIEIERYDSDTSEAIELLGTNNFSGNANNGLQIYANGPITLHSITANNNSENGTYIRGVFELDPDMDDWGYAAAGLGGTLTITGTNNFNDNAGSGLEAYVDGKITASNLNASGNGYFGALLSTCAGYEDEYNSGFICYNDPDYDLEDTYEFYNEDLNYDVTISGDNVFGSIYDGEAWGNEYAGLEIITYGDIKLGTSSTDSVTVQNNYGEYGAKLQSGVFQSYYDEEYDEWGLDYDTIGGGNITLDGTHLYGGYNEDREESYGNSGYGLVVRALNTEDGTGQVSIETKLAAISNEDAGVYMRGSNGAKIANITSMWNGGDGITIASANGDVEVSDSEFSDNEEEGLDAWYFDSTALSIKNVKANGNMSNGIWAGDGVGDVTIDQTEANGNLYEGMYFEDIYQLKITDSEASENGIDDESDGIYASANEVNLENVTVNGNYGNGMWIVAEDVTIKDVEAMENDAHGISIFTSGDVLVKNSEASSNGAYGLAIYGSEEDEPGDYTISCSTFNTNSSIGVIIDLANNVNLWGVNASGNGETNIAVSSYVSLNESASCTGGGCVCKPSDNVEPITLEGLVVPVVGGENVTLECGRAWTMLQLDSQDAAKFSGMCGSQVTASLAGVSAEALPAALPGGMLMGSAMTAGVNGSANIPVGGSVRITFNVPARLEGKTLSILFWDADAGVWVKLPGVQVNADGTATVTVDFGGTFVLVGE